MRNFLLIVLAIAVSIGAYYAFGHYLWSDLGEESVPEESGNISLEGSSWKWEYTDTHNGERVAAPAGEGFVLTFAADGRLNSTTDCNSLGGIYSQEGEVLSMGQFAMTKMFCAGSMETTYVEHLGLVNSFTLFDDVLTMNMNRDFGTMVFKRR